MVDRSAILRTLYLAAARRVSAAEKGVRQNAEDIFRGRRKFSPDEAQSLIALDEALDREKDRLHRIESAIEQVAGMEWHEK